MSKWLREKIWDHLWSHHSEKCRKAWFASFSPELWPGEEVVTESGSFLRLKDGTMLSFADPVWILPSSERELVSR